MGTEYLFLLCYLNDKICSVAEGYPSKTLALTQGASSCSAIVWDQKHVNIASSTFPEGPQVHLGIPPPTKGHF